MAKPTGIHLFMACLTIVVASCNGDDPPAAGDAGRPDAPGFFSDTSRPTVLSLAPTDGNLAAPVSTSIRVALSKDVVSAGASSSWPFTVLRLPDLVPVVARSVNYAERSFVFTPTVLTPNTDYEVRLDSGITDAGGRSIVGNRPDGSTVWRFRTAPVPHLGLIAPSEDQSGVELDASVVMSFDRAMNPASFSGDNFFVVDTASKERIAGRVVCEALVCVFVGDAPFQPGHRFRVTLTTGVVDTNGSPLAEGRVWAFSTRSRGWTAEVPALHLAVQDVVPNDAGHFLLNEVDSAAVAGSGVSPFLVRTLNSATGEISAADRVPPAATGALLKLDSALSSQRNVCMLFGRLNASESRTSYGLYALLRSGTQWSRSYPLGEIADGYQVLTKTIWDGGSQCFVFWVSGRNLFVNIGNAAFSAGSVPFLPTNFSVNSPDAEGIMSGVNRQFDVVVIAPGHLRVVYYVQPIGSTQHRVYSRDYIQGTGWTPPTVVAEVGATTSDIKQVVGRSGQTAVFWPKNVGVEFGLPRSQVWGATRRGSESRWATTGNILGGETVAWGLQLRTAGIADSGEIGVQYSTGVGSSTSPDSVVIRDLAEIWQAPVALPSLYRVALAGFDRSGTAMSVVYSLESAGMRQIYSFLKQPLASGYLIPSRPTSLWPVTAGSTPYFAGAVDRQGTIFLMTYLVPVGGGATVGSYRIYR